ncbi:MAG: FKBP-type peptidyl-prolyl cis-trans isomerase [Prevotella sp.]
MKKYTLLYSLLFFVACLFAISCSNDIVEKEEFPNWQATNKAFFSKTLSQAKTSIASGDNTWKIFRSWTLPGADANYKAADDEQVVVKVLKSGTATQHPLSTDSVLVAYRARLLPSTTYPNGFAFMQTYLGGYNAQTNGSVILPVVGTIISNKNTRVALPEGYSTAIQQMVVGDRWEVYIPENLGFAAIATSAIGIPNGSTIIYDITLQEINPTKSIQ